MNVKDNLTGIVSELGQLARQIDPQQLAQYTNELAGAKRIFAAGAGRSGLCIRAFAMRLMHLGKEVHVLGDVTTPHAGAGDLLLLGSGSGETKSLVAAAEKAKGSGMRIALNTMDAASTLAAMADVIVVLPGISPKLRQGVSAVPSVQPMGSSYEQLSLLVYDAVIMALMEPLGQSGDQMFARHANIE